MPPLGFVRAGGSYSQRHWQAEWVPPDSPFLYWGDSFQFFLYIVGPVVHLHEWLAFLLAVPVVHTVGLSH
eukprot:8065148-Ditylum_brightwellii.AAC.1